MTTDFEKLRDELLSLPMQSRASLAHSLIASLDERVEEDVQQLWFDEIRIRGQMLKSGRASLRPADDVLRDAREKLRCLK